GRHRPAWRGLVRAGIFPLQRPQPRRASGQGVIQSAANLNGADSAPRQVHHTWGKGQRIAVWASGHSFASRQNAIRNWEKLSNLEHSRQKPKREALLACCATKGPAAACGKTKNSCVKPTWRTPGLKIACH